MNLSRVIFWDTNYDSIDWDKKARYVIARVMMYGTIEDWNAIKSYYGFDVIKKEMLQERFLDKKTLSFLSLILNIPKEEFRCYKMAQSSQKHWDF